MLKVRCLSPPIQCTHSIPASLAAASKAPLHAGAVLAVSCAVAEAASQLSSRPLFFHLSSTRTATPFTDSLQGSANTPCALKVDVCEDLSKMKGVKTYQLGGTSPISSRERGLSLAVPPLSRSLTNYAMPLPVVASLGQGSGKLRIREICLCPLPGPPTAEQIKTLQKMHAQLGKQLVAKFGVCYLANTVIWNPQ